MADESFSWLVCPGIRRRRRRRYITFGRLLRGVRIKFTGFARRRRSPVGLWRIPRHRRRKTIRRVTVPLRSRRVYPRSCRSTRAKDVANRNADDNRSRGKSRDTGGNDGFRKNSWRDRMLETKSTESSAKKIDDQGRM